MQDASPPPASGHATIDQPAPVAALTRSAASTAAPRPRRGAPVGEKFEDEGTYLTEFLEETWAHCARCDAFVVVRWPRPYRRNAPSFRCPQCLLGAEGRGAAWFGPASGTARRRCRSCGVWLSRVLESSSGFGPKEIELRCTGAACGDAPTIAPVSWRGQTPCHEPAFGLRLRLATDCKGHTLWAYNPAHLAFLKSYAEASLRERTPNRNATLVSRLPKWLSAAKNRPAVLSAIKRLEDDAGLATPPASPGSASS